MSLENTKNGRAPEGNMRWHAARHDADRYFNEKLSPDESWIFQYDPGMKRLSMENTVTTGNVLKGVSVMLCTKRRKLICPHSFDTTASVGSEHLYCDTHRYGYLCDTSRVHVNQIECICLSEESTFSLFKLLINIRFRYIIECLSFSSYPFFHKMYTNQSIDISYEFMLAGKPLLFLPFLLSGWNKWVAGLSQFIDRLIRSSQYISLPPTVDSRSALSYEMTLDWLTTWPSAESTNIPL